MPEHLRVLADKAYRRLCGFLHDVAEISGKLELSRSLKALRFDLKHFAAKLCPCKSVDNADRVVGKKRVRLDLARP